MNNGWGVGNDFMFFFLVGKTGWWLKFDDFFGIPS